MRKLLSFFFSTLQGGVRGGLLFVALLATTSLWAYDFQCGDLYYKVPGGNGIESLPFVPNPGAGRTTVVLYVPENTPAGCYAVGSVNNWGINDTHLMFTPVEGATSERWVACTFDYAEDMQIKVLALPSDPAIAPSWSFQWGRNMDGWNDLEEDNVVILEGTGYMELENSGEPKLVELADNGVVYIEVKDWANNPYIEPIPCETAAFKHPFGGGDWVYREATKTADATFELNALYGNAAVVVATDVNGSGERLFPEDQIAFVGDVAQGDSVNFKFISEKSTYVGRMIVTLIEKGTGSNDNPWYAPSKKSPIAPQKRASIDLRRKVVVTYQSESSDNYAYLTTAYIPETVVYNGKTYEVVGIDEYAFANSPITSVTIGNSVTSIGNGAFHGCNSLKNIIVTNNNSIYDSRNNCNAIVETATNTVVVGCQATNMPSSITSIGPGAFAYCTSLTSIYIPNSVTSIGGSAFSSCSSLNSITIPNSVTSIGGSAFSGCSSLNSITIPNSITSIESKVFYRCSSLTSITIPNSVTSIGYDAFSGCSGLTSITIPNSVTEIGSYAFRECEKLGTLVLGDKIKEIEDYAFKECNKLYHIYCYAPEPPIADESIFTNYNVNLYVPCNYLDNYKYDRVFGSFRYIQCIESEDVTTNDVVVNPGANDVTITWPTEDNANNYTIVIEKDGEVFCTLTFNADGQLLNIAFAPGRDGNHPVQYAEQAGNGYRFTVTGLEEGTHYAYNIDVRDTANKTIKSYTGEFTTESMTAVENTHSQSPISNCQKILYEDHIYILRDGKTYTIMGAEVK